MSAVTNQCLTTDGRKCRGCPDCMGIPAPALQRPTQVSRLIRRARHGRIVTNIAWHTAAQLRTGAMDMRRRMSLERLYKSEVARIREVEQEAYDEIKSRPYDVEEMRDLELMMVVSNLTNFRINRLAYAGRVLP